MSILVFCCDGTLNMSMNKMAEIRVEILTNRFKGVDKV